MQIDKIGEGSLSMKIGIAGGGMIVHDFCKAASKVAGIEITSLFARKEEVVNELMGKYNILYGYCSYDELLADKETEFIYIALPNHLHYEFAKKALEAGKHLIVEKPFTVTLMQAKDLAEYAKSHHLYVFEAISNQYNPCFYKMKELLPTLGDIKIVEVNYSQYSSRYDRFKQGIITPVFDKNMAGGALRDLGIYNIHLIVGLFGQPKTVQYFANMERGVDTSGILVMEYTKFKTVSICAKDCSAPLNINIQGDKGYINSQSPANVLDCFVYQTKGQSVEEYPLAVTDYRLEFELEAFEEIYRKQDFEQMGKGLLHTLSVMEVLEEACSFIK